MFATTILYREKRCPWKGMPTVLLINSVYIIEYRGWIRFTVRRKHPSTGIGKEYNTERGREDKLSNLVGKHQSVIDKEMEIPYPTESSLFRKNIH